MILRNKGFHSAARLSSRAERRRSGPDGWRVKGAPAFTPEALKKGAAPFFTTRNVGLGLGLTVSRKIVETHKGKLEIVPPLSGASGFVRISLPLEPPVTVRE